MSVDDAPVDSDNPYWEEKAACNQYSGLFVYQDGGTRLSRKQILEAVHICNMVCPVLSECKSFARKFDRWTCVVIAGEYHGIKGNRS